MFLGLLDSSVDIWTHCSLMVRKLCLGMWIVWGNSLRMQRVILVEIAPYFALP